MTVQVINKAPIWDESYYNSERKNYKPFGALNKSEFPQFKASWQSCAK